jgi:hypothetical protein
MSGIARHREHIRALHNVRPNPALLPTDRLGDIEDRASGSAQFVRVDIVHDRIAVHDLELLSGIDDEYMRLVFTFVLSQYYRPQRRGSIGRNPFKPDNRIFHGLTRSHDQARTSLAQSAAPYVLRDGLHRQLRRFAFEPNDPGNHASAVSLVRRSGGSGQC